MHGFKMRENRFYKYSKVAIVFAILFSLMGCKPLESILGMSDEDGDETVLLLGLALLLSQGTATSTPDFESAPSYSVQTYEQAGDFVTVKPGVAYLCGIQSTDDGSGNYVEDVSKSRVILSKAILPPLESEARMLGGIIVKETPWGRDHPSATYNFMAPGEGDQIASHTSCDVETVQDASANQYLILAYDTLDTYYYSTSVYYDKRKMEFQVIPLEADGSVKSRDLWVTNTRDIPEPDRMLPSTFSASITQLDTRGSNIEIGVVGKSIYITAMNDEYGYQDVPFQAPVTIYYPTVEDARAETNYKTVLHEPGPEDTRPAFHWSLMNTWDTTVVGDEFVVATLTWEIERYNSDSVAGIRYWWLKDGVVDRTQEIVADQGGPLATNSGIYNYRVDADYWDNRTGTGSSGMFQAVYSDLSTLTATPGTNDWAKEIRFALADDAGQTLFKMRTGLEFSFSDLLLETEDTTVPDQHINITEGGPELMDTVRSVSSWDSLIHNGKIYILFRDPTGEPAEPRFALYSPAVFTSDVTDTDGLNAEQPQLIWPTPEYESRWSALKGGSFPESYRGTSETTYALPDMADFRTRTRCQIFNQEFEEHSDLAYTFEERGTAPYPFFLLDPYVCNNLLKTRFYKQSDSAPEQLLIMHPDSDYKMRLDLVDLP